jgi:hypothetical protein
MTTPSHTQFLVSALKHATVLVGSRANVDRDRVKLQALEARLRYDAHAASVGAELARDRMAHEATVRQIDADLARDALKAIVERRVEAVQSGFAAILGTYADQARHYMDQQARFAEAHIMATDPIQRASYHARLSEIDTQLTRIRADALLLFRDMTKVVILLGGSMVGLSQDRRALLCLE